MRVTRPITITESMLTGGPAEPGSSETVWNAATNYATGALAISTTTHRVYERLAPGGVDAATPDSDATKWRDAGPTNRHAMFDLLRNSQTVVSGGALSISITPGRRANSIGLVGLYGSSVTIQQHDGATETFSRDFNLLVRNTTTATQYCFGPFRVRKALVVYDMPLISSAKVTITVQPYAGEAKCGGVVLGTDDYMGMIVDEPVSDRQNFSKTTRDEFGNATLVPRRGVPDNSHRLSAPAAILNRLRELRDDLDAVPALYSGKDDQNDSAFFDTLLVLGIYKKFTISMNGPDRVKVDLQLEEI